MSAYDLDEPYEETDLVMLIINYQAKNIILTIRCYIMHGMLHIYENVCGSLHVCLESGFYAIKLRDGTYRSAGAEETSENVV
jgi:hypothetical protein